MDMENINGNENMDTEPRIRYRTTDQQVDYELVRTAWCMCLTPVSSTLLI